MKERKLILFSLAIPALSIVMAYISKTLEHYFRMSEKYHYIYSYGAFSNLLVQIFLVLVSFLIGLHVIVNRREYSLKTKIIALLAGSSLFLYITAAIAYVILKEFWSSLFII